MVDWIGLLGPIAYIGVLVGSLGTFSLLNRKRKAAKDASLKPWFGPHTSKNIYLSLLHLEPGSGPAVPESVLKAALLRRATEDIHRVLEIRKVKQALSSLLQRGSIGDNLWQSFQRAEKEIEDELRDVVTEANAFSPNWGATIFQTANEMAANSILRTRIDDIQARAKTEIDWWERKRAAIQQDFMKELTEGAVDNGTSIGAALTTRKSSTGGSDEDTVLVESGGPAATAAKGTIKKRKGKK